MSENLRVLRFAVIVCLVCSALVSTAALGLRERQEANLRRDVRKNILKAVSLYDPTLTPDQVNERFEQQMKGMVVDAGGTLVADRMPADVDPDRDPNLRALYACENGGKVVAYAFPIEGQGLWSTVYGYLALDGDLDTVKGITFYKHGETPGLGAEVEQDWFQQQFVGKKVRDAAGELVSVGVVKGKAVDRHPDDLEHYVDGISGATITSSAVTRMVREALQFYEPYFATVRPGRETT